MALRCNPFGFLTLIGKERQFIKAMVRENTREGPHHPIIYPVMHDESFHCYLALTSQMTFNVRKNKLWFLWFDGDLFNIYS